MTLKKINLPAKIDFPVKIIKVHVIAGELISKGDPIYTLETSTGKRGILRAPFEGKISEGPMAIEARFMEPSPVIGIVTSEGARPGAASDNASGNRSRKDSTAASSENKGAPPSLDETSEHPIRTESAKVSVGEDVLDQEKADYSFILPTIGTAMLALIGSVAAVLPGVLFNRFGTSPDMGAQFLIYLGSCALLLVIVTLLLSLTGVFGGRRVVPSALALLIFAAAYSVGFGFDPVRHWQKNAESTVMALIDSSLGTEFHFDGQDDIETKEVVQLAIKAEAYQKRDHALGYFSGEVRAFAFGFCPRGWAEANGNIMSVAQNSALYSLFGTYYGGDGRTGFGLPDLRGRHIRGVGDVQEVGSHVVGQKGGQEHVSVESGNKTVHAGQSDLTLKYCVSLWGLYPSRS